MGVQSVGRPARLASLALLAIVLGGCELLVIGLDAGQAPPPVTEEVPAIERSGGDRFPDVLRVELRPVGPRTYDVAVTISSPYDSPERYADGWRVIAADGEVLGTHTLLHDHASEQPFTRVQRGLVIPDGVEEVTVEGRDQANGYGGLTLTVEVPPAP